MKSVITIYEKISILSLDVVAGAVCCSAMFARQMHIKIFWYQYFVLASSVWLIYTIDHLLDAVRNPTLISPRHRFHKKYQKTLCILSVLVCVITTWLAFTKLPIAVIWFGMALGASMLVYLALTHFFSFSFFFKEGWVAFLYTLGVWGSVAVQTSHIQQTHLFAGGIFGMIILQQAMLLAWYESEEDTQQEMLSLMQRQNAAHLHLFLKALIILALGATIGCLLLLNNTSLDQKVWLTLLIIASLLSVITFFSGLFREAYSYRFLSDGILLLPVWMIVDTF
ncbi:hypothetical protein QNI19_22710 [Cytophagaceae bacterium DM2B3-1]|uniref:Prenyltransferase n=1 Tax=Xanthocytophaga flava TaxID=3048013 RepID=A0ABT7CPU1_9BACT|nr:hypothetical protein [Xanthocytophaga flavus]MDJ1495766.1 hypothetical protein [Xanthocytophaga flavus]